MPVLTKINTNSIAEDAITGDKFSGDAYLANTATQNISGTYSENRLYTSDAYTLSGNATVNSHLTLSSVKPTGDVVLTAGGAYTLTGTGVLSGGSLLAQTNTDASQLVGALGSTVTGSPSLNLSNATFRAGMVRQVKWQNMGNVAAASSETYLPGTIQFNNSIISTSQVMLFASGCGAKRTASNDNNLDAYFSSADGGSLGAGSSGFKWLQDFGAYSGTTNHKHDNFSGHYLVETPGTTTPSYRIYIDRTQNYEIHFIHMSIWEITG